MSGTQNFLNIALTNQSNHLVFHVYYSAALLFRQMHCLDNDYKSLMNDKDSCFLDFYLQINNSRYKCIHCVLKLNDELNVVKPLLISAAWS